MTENFAPCTFAGMSHEKSEEMMQLLKELAVLKEMDGHDNALPPSLASDEAQTGRARRRREISEEMHRLAAESKDEAKSES